MDLGNTRFSDTKNSSDFFHGEFFVVEGDHRSQFVQDGSPNPKLGVGLKFSSTRRVVFLDNIDQAGPTHQRLADRPPRCEEAGAKQYDSPHI